MLTLIVGAAVAFLIWLCLSPRIAPVLYNRFLFHPGKERGDRDELIAVAMKFNGKERFFVNSRGARIHTFSFGDITGKTPVLFYSMGKDGDIARRAETISLLMESGASLFIYEYAGYGDSEGRPTYKGLLSDAQDAYDFLTGALKTDPASVVFYGESLGAAISCWLLGRRRPRGVILKSGFASLTRVAREKFAFLRLYPDWLFPQPLLDSARALRANPLPTLVIHGAGDRMIGSHHPRLLIESAKGLKALVDLPDSRHSFMSDADKKAFSRAIASFLERLGS